MLQFKKSAPFEGTILLTPNPDGIDCIYTVIKATFGIGNGVVVADKQLPITMADQYYGDPGKTSIRVPTDVTLTKPVTDILLRGAACSSRGQFVTQMDVSMRVGSLRKTVRVFGDRVWDKGVFGHRISDPEPFQRLPLVWERAFGGADVVSANPPRTLSEDRNPVGRGFRVKNGEAELSGLKLPNVEDPGSLISSWKDRPAPAGFAPLCPHWIPRKNYAGTYDEAWQQQRSPYLPSDFDSRFFLQSPFVTPGYLAGGEEIEISGVHPSGTLRFELPQYRFEVHHLTAYATEIVPANLDTVLVDSDEMLLILLWRSAFPCDKRALKVKEVRVVPRSRS